MPRKGKIALFFIAALFTLSVISDVVSLYDPFAIDLESVRQAPGMLHPLGTDTKGRDMLARVLYGGKISIGVALTAALVSAAAGFSVGLLAGYFGGRTDLFLMSIVDFLLSFPSLLLAVAISIVLPPGLYTVMIALAVVGWTSFARLIRGRVLTLRDAPFVEAARAMGCGHLRIIVRHIAPLCGPLCLVMMGIKIGGFVLAEATLGFLGLGAQPPVPTWGSMISAHRAHILTSPWMVIFPGVALSLTAFCFNIVGEALKEKFAIRDV